MFCVVLGIGLETCFMVRARKLFYFRVRVKKLEKCTNAPLSVKNIEREKTGMNLN